MNDIWWEQSEQMTLIPFIEGFFKSNAFNQDECLFFQPENNH